MWGRRSKLAVAGAVVATALVATGCGGGSSAPIVPVQGASGASGANGGTALSKSAFINQGDAICGEANAAIDALGTGAVANDQKVQASQELQISRSELNSLRSLMPPQQDRSTLDRFISALEAEVRALGNKKAAVEGGGDPSAAESQAVNAASSAQTAAQAYGFKDCAKGAQAQSTTGSTTTAPAPTTTTPVVPPATTPPASGGTGGGNSGGGTGTGGGGSGGGGGGGSGGVSP